MFSAICELVKSGLSVHHAAQKLHVHHSTVGRWRRESPDFDTAVLAAEADFIDSQIANIRTAAKTSWQAAAWLLERKWPAHFSQPQVQLNMLGGPKIEFTDFKAVIEKVKRSPVMQAALGNLIPAEVIAPGSSQNGQNVTNQERPTHGSSSETAPSPSAEE